MKQAENSPNARHRPVTTRERLRQAEALYRAQGVRFSPGQQRVYRLLLDADAPMTAYQLLDALGRSEARRIYPQTVYRTLALLQAHGLIHKLESANAYLPCVTPAHPHDSIHLLCDVCGNAEELVDANINHLLTQDAQRQRFRIQHQMIELRGVCAGCDRG